MTKEEYRKEISYYIDDIYKWFDEGDMKSCMIMARGLVKLLLDYKKSIRS